MLSVNNNRQIPTGGPENEIDRGRDMAFTRIAATFAAVTGTVTLLGVAPATAQTGDQPSAARASSPGDEALQEVVVVARRREERAQTVPIAINVISPVLLKDRKSVV